MAALGTLSGARIMVAAEATFGSASTSDARNLDISGLSTTYPLQVTRASWKAAAEAGRMTVRDTALTSLQGGNPPVVVDAAYNASGPVDSISGELVLTLDGRSFGSTAPASSALGIILASGLDAELRTPGTSFTATEATENTMTHASPDDGKVEVGDILFVVQANATGRYVKVSGYNAGTRTITTLEPHGIPNAGTATVRLCHMYFPAYTGEASGASFVLEMSMPDEEQTRRYVGCRLRRFTVRTTEAGGIEYEVSIMAYDGERATTPALTVAAPLPLGITGTKPLVARVAPIRATQNHSASAAPWNGTASALPARSWEVGFECSHAPVSDQATRCRVSDVGIPDVRVTGTFTQTSPTGTEIDWQRVTRLSHKHAVGFTAAGANAAGNGLCMWVGAVECAEDPGITFDEADRTQVVAFRAGDYSGDDSTDYGKVNASAIIAFPC